MMPDDEIFKNLADTLPRDETFQGNLKYLKYMQAVSNIYCNRNQNLVDQFVAKNELVLREVSKKMFNDYPFELKTLYRGILVGKEHIKKKNGVRYLRPMPDLRYISFSENPISAKEFADVNSEMSQFLRLRFPHYKGYVIQFKPEPRDIFIHYKWSLGMRIDDVLVARGITGSAETIRSQKEVTLWQNNKLFRLIPYGEFYNE